MTLLDSIAAMPQLQLGGNYAAIQYFATPWGGISDYPTSAPEGGRQIVVRFANGFGASIICYPRGSAGGDVGAWELMVVRFDRDSHLWTLVDPTAEPVGHIATEDVIKFLRDIAENGLTNVQYYNDGFVNQEVN